MGTPFLTVALGVDRFLAGCKRGRTYRGLVSSVTGAFPILVGVMVLDRLSSMTALFERYGIGAYLETAGG
ncbi:hypothetical protein [Nitrospira sp. Kam-Ns4a]